MKRQTNVARLVEIIRFYQAAAINALFGFGIYALFVWLGLNIYLAQILSHILGVAFNYFTYRIHVFRDSEPAKGPFLLAYGLNYLVNLASLALISRIVASPYLAGLGALFLTSILNYFVLKHVVFARPRTR